MDLSTVKPREFSVNLVEPGGYEFCLVFHMQSRHSDDVQRVIESHNRKWEKKGRGKGPSMLERRAHSMEIILAAVTGWEWESDEDTFGGEQPPFSRDTLKAWLKEYPWMVEFLSGQLLEDENFFSNSET